MVRGLVELHDIHVQRVVRKLNCGAKVTVYREIVSLPEQEYNDYLERQYTEEN